MYCFCYYSAARTLFCIVPIMFLSDKRVKSRLFSYYSLYSSDFFGKWEIIFSIYIFKFADRKNDNY